MLAVTLNDSQAFENTLLGYSFRHDHVDPSACADKPTDHVTTYSLSCIVRSKLGTFDALRSRRGSRGTLRMFDLFNPKAFSTLYHVILSCLARPAWLASRIAVLYRNFGFKVSTLRRILTKPRSPRYCMLT